MLCGCAVLVAGVGCVWLGLVLLGVWWAGVVFLVSSCGAGFIVGCVGAAFFWWWLWVGLGCLVWFLGIVLWCFRSLGFCCLVAGFVFCALVVVWCGFSYCLGVFL